MRAARDEPPAPDPGLEVALGRLALACLLVLSLPLGALCSRIDRLDPTPPEALTLSEVDRARLGGPVSCACPDPEVWLALPRIGPVRARALADAARQGELRAPPDLLRIPGIGTKMARAIADRTSWECASTVPNTAGQRAR